MFTILLILFLVIFLVVNLLVLAICRSAALADRKLESRHIIRAAEFSSAITKPIGKRDPDKNNVENPNVALKQYGLFP